VLPMNKQSYIAATVVLVVLACFRIAMPQSSQIDEQKSSVLTQIPYQIGNWKGKDSEVEETVYQILETRSILSRDYENAKGDRISLLLVASNRDRRVAHPPEVCYTSSNYNIIKSGEKTIRILGRDIEVKEFVAQDERNPKIQENVLYVYKVGNEYTTNYYAQQVRFALDRLKNQNSQVLLIRLSGNNTDQYPEFLEAVLKHVS